MTATSPPTVNTDSVSPPVETNRQQIAEQTERAISDSVEGAAARVFRGHRSGARDCLAAGGLAGIAAFRGHRAGRVHAGSLDDLAHAKIDRPGYASRSVPLGVGGVGRSRTAEGPAD